MTEYIKSGEVADMVGVSRKTIANWSNEGKIPCCKVEGKHRVYDKAEILIFIEQLALIKNNVNEENKTIIEEVKETLSGLMNSRDIIDETIDIHIKSISRIISRLEKEKQNI